jgi:hypothetical protein
MAEHECRYSGFSGGKRLCPVCLNDEPTAQGEDHADDQGQGQEAEGQEQLDVNDEEYESTDVVEADHVEDEPAEEPKRRRYRR